MFILKVAEKVGFDDEHVLAHVEELLAEIGCDPDASGDHNAVDDDEDAVNITEAREEEIETDSEEDDDDDDNDNGMDHWQWFILVTF